MTTEQGTRWAMPALEDVPRDQLRARLDIYSESMLLRLYEEAETWVRHVNADQMASVITQHVGASTGLLPRDALWWRHSEAGTVTAIWKQPMVWPVALQSRAMEPAERLSLPMPGLVFICTPGQAPWVFACREYPESPLTPVYRMPTFNMFHNGRACPGNHSFPTEAGLIPGSFFQSHFSMTGDTRDRSKSHPDDLYALWKEIDGEDEYPVEDLVEQGSIGQIMEIPK